MAPSHQRGLAAHHRTGVTPLQGTSPGDPVDIFLERAAMALLLWWSVREIQHGTTKYLESIGALTLVGAVARTILADPKYGLSPRPERLPTRANH